MKDKHTRLRRLPSVDGLLAQDLMQDLMQTYSRALVVDAIRVNLEEARRHILQAKPFDLGESALLERIADYLRRRLQPRLRPVINATGVILHTNLGRALLSKAAQQAMLAAAGAYSTLEFDLDRGTRGSRLLHASQLLRDLTGAEDAIVLNNNAAALILILRALAAEREVVISRGQLVEIGGGFRIPAIMRESGARLVEVGATNRTHIADFAAAASEQTAMFLRIHASNFKQVGFVEQPSWRELVETAHQHGLLAVDDLGSGALMDTARFGLDSEPTIQESIQAGADLVCFSGDKLLGGPQAGIIVGKQAALAKLKTHPLTRALRVDKLTYAALTATLEHYRRGEALARVPVWRMISRSLDEITAKAGYWAERTGGAVAAGNSTVGGGSLPGASLPTALLALDAPAPHDFMARLRQADPPVIARIAGGRVLFDPRTVLPEQEADFMGALLPLLSEQKGIS